jgi:membrane associated rhomboid family serine protease
MRYTSRYAGPSFSFGGRMPDGVKWLLIANVAVFLLYFFAIRAGGGEMFRWFALWPRLVLQAIGIPQLFTYLFIHDPFGFSHVLFNMLALWMFGSDLERTWGKKRFLQYYFFCGVGAGVCVVLAHLLFGNLDTRTIGASGAVYGILLAFGMLFPNATVLFAFIFPMKAKYFVAIIGAIAFLSSMGANDGVSHVAHLGGMVFGFLYLKMGLSRTDILGTARREYENWKVRRARRKFEVYMKKRDRGPERFH